MGSRVELLSRRKKRNKKINQIGERDG